MSEEQKERPFFIDFLLQPDDDVFGYGSEMSIDMVGFIEPTPDDYKPGFILVGGIIAVTRIGFRINLKAVVKPLLAAVIMGICLCGFSLWVEGLWWHLALVLPFGCAFFIFILLVLKGIPRDVLDCIR